LGIALAREGDYVEAEQHLRASLRLDPSDLQPHRALGHIYFSWQRPEEALYHFTLALELQPGDAELNFNIGVCLQALGRIDEARAQYGKTLRIDPGFEKARAYLDALP
jgi:Flp pilus assembly protein TadD